MEEVVEMEMVGMVECDLCGSSLVLLGPKHVINCPHHLSTMMMMVVMVMLMVMVVEMMMMIIPVSFQQVQ